MYALMRLDQQSFGELLEQWKPHFNGDEDLLYEHCRPHLEHAQRICGESPVDPCYGIFALTSASPDGAKIFEGFTHVNHKLPRSPDSEVRLVWNTLHPRYETALTPQLLANFTVSYILEAIRLAKSELPSQAVRVHLGNGTDRRYAEGIVAYMRSEDHDGPAIELAGNWLHIKGVDRVELPTGE